MSHNFTGSVFCLKGQIWNAKLLKEFLFRSLIIHLKTRTSPSHSFHQNSSLPNLKQNNGGVCWMTSNLVDTF